MAKKATPCPSVLTQKRVLELRRSLLRSATSMSSGALNPDNYLGHLSPADAFQFEVARNLYLAVLGVRGHVCQIVELLTIVR